MRAKSVSLTACVLLVAATTAHAQMVEKSIDYALDGTQFQGTLVYDDGSPAKRPGLVMVPGWLGPTPAAVAQAKTIAGTDYVVFLADMYGVGVRPTNPEQAGEAAGAVRADRALMRRRAALAVDVLSKQAAEAPLAADRLGAIGFCFGGGTVLELARSGSDRVAGVVSFHGNLDTPNPLDAANIKTRVLVLHGADDPYVPQETVLGFQEAMRKTEADWQFVAFGNTVHSFTDPDANLPGQAQYNPTVARRAFAMMKDFFDEAFAAN